MKELMKLLNLRSRGVVFVDPKAIDLIEVEDDGRHGCCVVHLRNGKSFQVLQDGASLARELQT